MKRRKRQLTAFEKELYHRHILLPEVSETGQVHLLESRVLVIGLGGLGSAALVYLSVCGVGEIGIADSDRVELSNLQRQILHGKEDVGKEKTRSAQQSVWRLRSDVRLNVYPMRITASNAQQIIAPYDFVIEATDNFESKFLINDVCVGLGKAFSHAGILGMYGQTMTIVPGAGPCFRCIFQEVPPPEIVETVEQSGVLGSVPGVVGALQATEAIKYLLNIGGLLVGRLLTWEGRSMVFREIKLPLEKRCEVCGSELLQEESAREE
ncbi:MAG: HesA/MoeB/ThiF family protein [Syntrophobacteria bacterium]